MRREKNLIWALLLIGILAVTFRLYGLSDQPPLGDEVLSAYSAENYVRHGQFGPTMPNHPNLRNLLLTLSMSTAGKGIIGLRGFSILFGLLSVPLLGILVYRLSSDRVAGALASFFLAVDPVHITFSRQSIQEVHTAFFFLAGCLAVTAALMQNEKGVEPKHYPEWKRNLLLLVGGVAFGLGLSSKWHAAFPLLVCLFVALQQAWRERSVSFTALAISTLVILPWTVYLLTYLPWFGRGYGIADWFFMQRELFEMTSAHGGNPNDIMVDLEPWKWFLQPFMGYGNFTASTGKPFVTVSMGNPIVWMLVLPSLAIGLLKKQKGVSLMAAFFLAAYLPLVFAGRPIWLLSSIAVTPFAFGLVGSAVAAYREKLGMKMFGGYLCAVLLVSLLLYPMTIGMAWDYEYLRPLTVRFSPH